MYLILILIQALLIRAASNEYIDNVRTTFKLPALAAGAVAPNRSFTAYAVGVRKQGDPTPVNVNDQFHLGSNTKAMTATLIAKYIEQGNFTWDTTLAQALPDYAGGMKPGHANITLALLASHRSGITSDTTLGNTTWYNSLRSASALDGRRTYVERVFSTAQERAQGQYEYSNINYILLGFIIDRRYGPWEDIIGQHLFQPLNMTDCGFGNFPEPNSTAVEGVWPHGETSGDTTALPPTKDTDNPPAIGPAGTVRCSPFSYSRFLALHLDGAKGIDTSILRAASFRRLHTPYDNQSSDLYTQGGWVYQKSNSTRYSYILTHDGSNNLNYARALLVPDIDAAYMALTNEGSGALSPSSSKVVRAVDSIRAGFLNGTIKDLPVVDGKTSVPSNSGAGGGASGKPNAAARRAASGVFVMSSLAVSFAVFMC